MPQAEPSNTAKAARPGTARAGRSRIALGAAILAYLLFVAYQSLAGGSLVACSPALVQEGGRLSWSDGLANLVAYLPLGLLSAAWLGPRRGVAALLGGFLAISSFSLTMELAQACFEGRVSSWFDWSTNSTGGLLGLLVLPRRTVHGGSAAGGATPLPGFDAAAGGLFTRLPLIWPVLLCVGAWLALSLAHWRFTLDVSTIRGNLAFLRHLGDWQGPEPWRFARHLSGWLTVGVALRALWATRLPASLALGALMLAALLGQLLLVRPGLSVDELLAIALAAALTIAIPSGSSGSVLARLVPVLALLAVCAYQLAPGRGGAANGGFEWWPQIGRGGLLSALEFALLFCWLAFAAVLSLRWLASRGVSIERRKFILPVVVVAAMFASEVAQAWIPGRTADTSAPLVTALAYLVAWALFGHHHERRPTRQPSRAAGALTARDRPTWRRPASSPPRP